MLDKCLYVLNMLSSVNKDKLLLLFYYYHFLIQLLLFLTINHKIFTGIIPKFPTELRRINFKGKSLAGLLCKL